jgi:hypothetical protein
VAGDETQEPTLRRGDQSLDGWVEYAQALLNRHRSFDPDLGYGELTVDGDFGNGTHNAVVAFQRRHDLMVDGIVGNQTWAALREEIAQAPGTDGRLPGTFVEHGFEARWFMEHWGAVYWIDDDRLVLSAINTGTEPIDNENVQLPTVTLFNDGDAHVLTEVRFHHETGRAVAGEPFMFVHDGLRSAISGLRPYRLDVQATMSSDYGGDVLATPVTGLPPEPPHVPDIVTAGAELLCTFGSLPSRLAVERREEDGYVHSTATVQDFEPGINIGSFGLCSSMKNPDVADASERDGTVVPGPCVPVVERPWVPGEPLRQVDGHAVLTLGSTCECRWSGTITIRTAGTEPSVQDH